MTRGDQAVYAARIARTHGFTIAETDSGAFRHSVYSRFETGSSLVWVFIEGDGAPWVDGGRVIADDPTAREPLALRLALQTPGSVLYLGRPCYLQSRSDHRCHSSMWTFARYSAAVVSSMNEALRLSLPDPTSRVVLVGYSGGGTIAALMARDNPRISVIVTIAGNLDVKAWSERHHYLPLSDSRNPADESALPATLKQVHLIGERDTKVTPLTASRYLSRLANEQVWRYPRFDHVCCWQQAWPDIRTRIQRAIESDAPLQAAPEN